MFAFECHLDPVILSEAKNLVPSVYSLGSYNVKIICNDEILRFGDEKKRASIVTIRNPQSAIRNSYREVLDG
jgi:hypothetical protein